MNEITLQWIEDGKWKTSKISDKQPSKNPGSIRLGRHPDWCDIIFPLDLTISRLHAEIFFNVDKNSFYLRKLPQGRRPPIVDGKTIADNEIPLRQGSKIILGDTKIKVANISINSSKSVPRPKYGLICPNPKCSNSEPRRLIEEKHLLVGCPYCGSSLAGARRRKF